MLLIYSHVFVFFPDVNVIIKSYFNTVSKPT